MGGTDFYEQTKNKTDKNKLKKKIYKRRKWEKQKRENERRRKETPTLQMKKVWETEKEQKILINEEKWCGFFFSLGKKGIRKKKTWVEQRNERDGERIYKTRTWKKGKERQKILTNKEMREMQSTSLV